MHPLFSIFILLVVVVAINNAQHWQTNSISGGWGPQTKIANSEISLEIPGISSTASLQVNKQVPYLEVLKLVQSFLKLKGEMAGRIWALINDNTHILAALRDTLITKISTIHNFTLTLIVILRKVMEFAVSLFGNSSVSAGFNFG
ncbi:uncharacterized protein [Euwallacea similis]|uniref:uncharacterized protein isoform X2 n=1 Tax=Euwallacea similis TaxID=1736056 RepID=UPI003450C828